MTKNMLDAQYLLNQHEDIKETLCKKSVILSMTILIAAIGIFSTAMLIEDKTSGLYLAVVCVPFLLATVALFRLIYHSKQLVYVPTGSRLISGNLYFDKSQMEVMETMLKADSPENIEWTGFKHNGNARLVYLTSADAKFAAVQLFEYVPYNYEPASEIYIYNHAKAHPIAQLLLQQP